MSKGIAIPFILLAASATSFPPILSMDDPSNSGSDELPNFMAMWDFHDPEESEKKFRECIPAAKQSGDAEYHAELLTQIARAQGLQGDFEAAHETLDETRSLLGEKMTRAAVRHSLERGRVFHSSGKTEKAKPHFLEAWERARKSDEDPLAVDAAHMLAIAEQDDPAESLKWNETALKLAEASEDERTKRWMAPLYNNTGWAHHDRGDYAKALEIFRKALEWHSKSGDAHSIHVAKWTVGRCLRSLGKHAEALEIQEEREAELSERGKADGFVFEELGELHLELGNAEEAKKYFALAYAELAQDEWFASNEEKRLQCCKTLGGVGE